jgi:hypothetical protein
MACEHKYKKTGFCEFDSTKDGKEVRIKVDLLECSLCSDLQEKIEEVITT